MDILMPQLGETVAEGKIVAWYRSVGDRIAPGDRLFEIETDKATMEVPTTAAGVLSEIRVPAGATVAVGAVVAVLSGAGSADARPGPVASVVKSGATEARDPFQAVKTPERNFGPATRRNGSKVTPVARRLAAEAGVDLGTLVGSGPHGRIVAKDIQAAASAAASERAPRERDRERPAADAASPAPPVRALFEGVPFQEIPVDGMRRTIARRLLEAKQSIPHFYLSADVAMGRLLGVRREINAASEGEFKLTVTDFVIKALALALQRVPEANAVWAEDAILRFKHSDLAVAVAVENGLFTPVIREAELKSMKVISTQMKALAERARNRALAPGDYRGGSMTISNLGMYGVRSFAAIVNPPHAGILAIGATDRRPVEGPGGGAVQFGDWMTVTLSCDHRVIDGALGARLLGAFKALLEAPLLLLA